MTKEQGDTIAKMYKDGASISTISREVGLGATSIRAWVRVNRAEYKLPRRRNLADKQGVNSYSVEVDCKWNLTLSREWIIKQWRVA